MTPPISHTTDGHAYPHMQAASQQQQWGQATPASLAFSAFQQLQQPQLNPQLQQMLLALYSHCPGHEQDLNNLLCQLLGPLGPGLGATAAAAAQQQQQQVSGSGSSGSGSQPSTSSSERAASIFRLLTSSPCSSSALQESVNSYTYTGGGASGVYPVVGGGGGVPRVPSARLELQSCDATPMSRVHPSSRQARLEEGEQSSLLSDARAPTTMTVTRTNSSHAGAGVGGGAVAGAGSAAWPATAAAAGVRSESSPSGSLVLTLDLGGGRVGQLVLREGESLVCVVSNFLLQHGMDPENTHMIGYVTSQIAQQLQVRTCTRAINHHSQDTLVKKC